MTVPTISNLPTVPATSDPNFETEAPALFNHIKNTFVSEMNSAISFINSSTFDATVEFKDGNFTAAKNFLYMIDTSSGGVSVTLPANPSTGDQLLLMDQKRSFGTNNLTIGRNSQNINGAASDVISKSTGALIRCIFQASYGWTVDLYEGEWESGTSAGDLVYNGGNVGIGTSSPATKLNIFDANPVIQQTYRTARTDANEYIAGGLESYFVTRDGNTNLGAYIYVKDKNTNSSFPTTIRGGEISIGTVNGSSGSFSDAVERLRIDADGKVGIGTSSPSERLTVKAPSTSSTAFKVEQSGDTQTALSVSVDSSDNGQMGIFDASENTKVFIRSSGDSYFNGGKVGIGTSSPGAKLHATGDIVAQNATNPTVSANDNGTLGASDKSVYMRYDTVNDVGVLGSFHNGTGAKNLVLNQLGGNVGIGTSAPDSNLAVCQPGSVAAGRGGQINFNGPWSGTATTSFAYIKGYKENGTSGQNGGKLALGTRPNAGNLTERMTIDSSGNVEVSTGNLVIGTAGKGIDFSANSNATGMSSELLSDYEEGTFTPAFIDTNGDATFTHDIQKGRYTKVGDCVYFSLTIGTDSVTAGTGDLKISGLPFTAQNAESQIKLSGAVGINYSWGTSPTHWLVNANSDAVILYKSVNPLTASKSADCGTTVDDNRLFMHGFYFV